MKGNFLLQNIPSSAKLAPAIPLMRADSVLIPMEAGNVSTSERERIDLYLFCAVKLTSSYLVLQEGNYNSAKEQK